MGVRARFIGLAGLTALLGGCAGTSGPAALPMAAPGPDKGYLPEARLFRLADAVPPPPTPGSALDLDDRARSDAYRVLAGGDRWLLATAHAEVRPELARQHFDCALGVRFQGQVTPRLSALLAKVLHDADHAAERIKARAHRPRPVADDPERVPCQRVTPAGRQTGSYPSGSATVGAAYGEVMAAVDPGHAAQAREIGRQIGVSRAVCGMHYDTDVRVGIDLGRAVGAAIVASPAFRDDLRAAQAELAAVRATGLTNPGCIAEAATLALPLPAPTPPAGA
ncbi:PA-phosphatase [Brevundimonas sp. VNH65]|uniref:PA-phosphatase n=1 Tax=Brevundimonas sp. VNH65 TaxID=3400917 RepID=UPI003BFFEBE3